MKLHYINLPHERFLGLGEAEQILYFRLAQLSNEIMHLHVLLISTYSCPEDASPEERQLNQFQHNFYLRLLCGTLTEAWNVIKKTYLGDPLSKKYNSILSQSAKDALRELKNYFNAKGRCLMRQVRDKFAYHATYNIEPMREVLSRWDKQSHQIAFGQINANTFYLDAELVRDWSIAIMAGDSAEAIREIFDQTKLIVSHFAQFSSELLIEMVKQVGFTRVQVDIKYPIKLEERSWLGFVTEPDSSANA